MAVLESNQYALWAAKQTLGVGYAQTTPTMRYRQVAGDLSLTPDYGSEAFSTGSRFGDAADYVNSLLGQGEVGVQAQPDPLGHIASLYFGTEAATCAVGSVVCHTFEADDAIAVYSTWWKQVGKAVGPLKQRFEDCRVGRLQLEGSTANKVVRVTPNVLSLKPGRNFTNDYITGATAPLTLDTEDPFLYTDGSGAYKFAASGAGFIAGTAQIKGQSQFNVTFDDNLQPVYGDGIDPFELFPGNSLITVNFTLLVDGTGYNEYLRLIYGTTTPAPNAAPTSVIPSVGAYTFYINRQPGAAATQRFFQLEVPGVRFNTESPIQANPDGGPVELAMAGGARLQASPNEYMARVRVGTSRTSVYS